MGLTVHNASCRARVKTASPITRTKSSCRESGTLVESDDMVEQAGKIEPTDWLTARIHATTPRLTNTARPMCEPQDRFRPKTCCRSLSYCSISSVAWARQLLTDSVVFNEVFFSRQPKTVPKSVDKRQIKTSF